MFSVAVGEQSAEEVVIRCRKFCITTLLLIAGVYLEVVRIVVLHRHLCATTICTFTPPATSGECHDRPSS
jgi:hypothetical protein